MDDPKPTYRAIFGAYWARVASVVEAWWLGFGLVMLGIAHAVYVAREPTYLQAIDQQTTAMASVLVAVVAFVVTFYYEFL
jgi:hypothetical protein